MKFAFPALAGVAMTFIALLPANAEEDSLQLSHPADTSQTYQGADDIDPFGFAVPLLTREVPAPSYGQRSADPSASAAEPMPMDQSMPGMDHSNMPGMSGSDN
jgi:hypothetical protein